MPKKMRSAKIKRKTTETDITGELLIDGKGKADIKTGIGFLDHMLTLFAFHGLFDLTLKAKGDFVVSSLVWSASTFRSPFAFNVR